MKKLFFVMTALCLPAAGWSQEAVPASSPNDVEALRQQVQALTETVKGLQQQLQKQQEALAKMNAGPTSLPVSDNNSSGSVAASPVPAASPAASAAPLFPTTDDSVVAASVQPTPLPATAASAPPAVNEQFPTTDAAVTNSPETLSATGAGASLTAPMTIAGGGKTYMNISFDGQFALAYSSDRNLDRLETGDHDPQQRGFNARNLELALDGAVDPY
ncbi:MAG: hypothetical protein H0W66_05575, partial [Chthoniobacterales bacterium]|nr:hypothetical protein [Chthoniobacterales bacterium]